MAFFDVDDTILRINSANSLVHAARKNGLMSFSSFMNAVYQVVLYKLKLKDPIKIVHKMGSWVAGIPVDKFNEMVEEIHRDIIINSIRPEIIEEIRKHKENNAAIGILSSAVTAICFPLADFLGIDHVLCSELEVIDNHFTGKPIGKFCFGEEKLVRIKEFCFSNNYSSNEAYYYGDSVDDLSVLKQVGHPVCITPDKKLKEIAHIKGWIVHQW